MAYFPDLSEYTYFELSKGRSLTRNVGWLDAMHDFPAEEAASELLDLLWQYCLVLVLSTRGLHSCEFCSSEYPTYEARGDLKVLLGSAEIRVFSKSGDVYAAPNLIYHYVSCHRYQPPAPFVAALHEGHEGPSPTTSAYFDRLKDLGLKWAENPHVEEEPVCFRFVRTEKGIEREYIRRK